MLLKTKFSQLAASEQYTVLWRAVHLKCFDILTGHGKSPFFFPPWILYRKPSSTSRLFCIKTRLPNGRSREKSAWEISVENTDMDRPWGWRWPGLSGGAGSRIRGPHWAAPSRPGRTETAGRRAVQGIPLNHATKKGAMRNKSLCILSHKCGQKNPSDSSLWY